MGVKFLNQNIVVNSTRPTGFKFPVGLTQTGVGRNSIDYLVVAGGGGGGGHPSASGGGGGAGGLIQASAVSVTDSGTYAVTVGGGGPSNSQGNYSLFRNSSPANTFYSYAVGGGRGGGGSAGGNGGSGGGGSGDFPAGFVAGGSGTPGQGNNGGGRNQYTGGGGGGGAGGAGQTREPGAYGIGVEVPWATTAGYTSGWYASGGSGNASGSGQNPQGGGGYGPSNSNGDPGYQNSGGGGGGAHAPQTTGGTGGKGVVIVRYAGSQGAVGGTVSSTPGYTIHTFTGDGFFNTNSSFIGTDSYAIN